MAPTTSTAAINPRDAAAIAFERCGQHTDPLLVGYEVWQTFSDDGVILPNGGVLLATVEGACRYGEALDLARANRTRAGRYAVIECLYACGHSTAEMCGRVR